MGLRRSPAPMRLLALVLFLVPLSGCVDPPAEASLTIDFNGQGHDPDTWTLTVGFDPSHRPALLEYDGRDVEHPDHYTVHDLMVQWSEDEGVPVQTGYFDGIGFSLDAIDGVAGDFSDGACWFWSLSIDGEASEVGMGEVEVRDGTAVAWTYTDCS